MISNPRRAAGPVEAASALFQAAHALRKFSSVDIRAAVGLMCGVNPGLVEWTFIILPRIAKPDPECSSQS